MATISKIRLANILYEGGLKRYNDETFVLDGNNTAMILENGGGKTVLVQMILQAVLPRHNHSGRKIWETLQLSSGAAHIAVEWLLDERPRRYLLTALTLYIKGGSTVSNLYVTEYGLNEKGRIEDLPFSLKTEEGKSRPASSGEINDYYLKQKNENFNSKTFDTIKSYQEYLEKNYQISYKEWLSISKINSSEGGIEDFFDNCATTSQLVNNLLIPTIEEAIEGENTEVFADIFEEHRQHIKEYKRLSRVIEENENIQSNLNDYVEAYKKFHVENEIFNTKKAIIKGLYNKAILDKEIALGQLRNLSEEEECLRKKQLHWEQKKSSYKVALEKERMTYAERDYSLAKGKLNQITSDVERKEYFIDKLYVNKKTQEHVAKKMKVQMLERQLKTMDTSNDVQALIEERNEFESQLLDVFHNELRVYEEKRGFLTKESTLISSQLERAQNQYNGWMREQVILNKEIGSKEGMIELIRKSLDGYKNELIHLESFEHSKSYRENCSRTLRDLSVEHEDIKTFILEEERKSREFEKQCYVHSEKISVLEGEKSSIKEQLLVISRENTLLYEQFSDISGKPLVGSDIYTSAEDIIEFVNQRIGILHEERETLIGQEAEYNYKNTMFKDVKAFVADPFLERKVSQLKKQFSYVETGVAYLAHQYEKAELQSIYELYAHWPVTLVTLESEKEKVWQRLILDIDQMEYPIVVVSDKDVQSIIMGKTSNSEYLQVMPKSWCDNLSEEHFNTWKRANKEKLIDYKEKRKVHENKIECYQSYLIRIKEFLNKYPHDLYEALQDKLSDILNNLSVEKREEENKRSLINNTRTLLNNKRKRQDVIIEEKRAYERQLDLIIKLIENQEKYETFDKKLKELNKKLDNLKNDLAQEVMLIEELTNQQLQIKNEKYAVIREIERIEEDSFFNRVKDVIPVPRKYEKEELKLLVKNIDNELGGITGQRENIEEAKRDLLIECNDLFDEIKSYEEKIEKSVYNDEIVLHGNGIKQIKDANQELNELKKSKKTLDDRVQDLKSVYDKLNGVVENMLFDYSLAYGELLEFEESLERVIENLDEEENKLSYQKKQLSKLYEEAKLRLSIIEQVVRELELKHEKYGYLKDGIKAIKVSEGLENDYKYNRLKSTKNLIEDLNQHSKKVQRVFDSKDEKKELFKNFCLTGISDPKLKKSTISFIDNRNSYKELCQWQNKIQMKIAQVLKMSSLSLKEVDKEIVKLIDRLYIYLNKVVQEFNILESKTKIKLKNDSKRIFKMTIPEFSEPIAKQSIRDHLIWMTSKIQESTYLNDDGSENISEVRKDVTSWLSTRTLLSKIFLSKDITVKCRKVTNDFKIKGLLTDWGHTNKWSGGEKWSKNMTLYLGIQNYLAEKRYVDIAKNKRNRAVLLDNPFGAASSGHVLEPVFLIADQLGYQLIALTSHSEGKYISDYFPIVYSCKLRTSKDKHLQIMTKEKEINYAFLRDHSPMSIHRLEEDEQYQIDVFSKL